ncbi:hypothetical protein CLV48_102164 [Cecembia rubra]|uniref:Uncharacterized protein n=1 Tax=Cecembia rubra TaxID=1485585 RepID=A0A2P8EA58_9BACT|nr:hypothetical protein CLV48_102164 [Cecembia rubra]
MSFLKMIFQKSAFGKNREWSNFLYLKGNILLYSAIVVYFRTLFLLLLILKKVQNFVLSYRDIVDLIKRLFYYIRKQLCC